MFFSIFVSPYVGILLTILVAASTKQKFLVMMYKFHLFSAHIFKQVNLQKQTHPFLVDGRATYKLNILRDHFGDPGAGLSPQDRPQTGLRSACPGPSDWCSLTRTAAWLEAIMLHNTMQFWSYTRVRNIRTF